MWFGEPPHPRIRISMADCIKEKMTPPPGNRTGFIGGAWGPSRREISLSSLRMNGLRLEVSLRLWGSQRDAVFWESTAHLSDAARTRLLASIALRTVFVTFTMIRCSSATQSSR